ncbi:hypothetical protein [Photorhabdus australis]|uniref:hypothetical protein n=1 Tax=Photorhabdus australis TaxID=286156 RepID=UPI00055D9042|nr:hypothetical protein [Photorhabdus australis]
MATQKNVLDRLKDRNITLGWDIVVAYNQESVNKLLKQQYVEKVYSNEHFVFKDWHDDNKTKFIEGLTVGAPLVSFEEASLSDANVRVTLNFLSGRWRVIQANTGTPIEWKEIVPGNGYKAELIVPLKSITGSVNSKKDIILSFKDAIVKDINLFDNQEPDFINYFKQSINEGNYTLGQLVTDSTPGLIPSEFHIRTQPHPKTRERGSQYVGNGAVLLFIKTQYGGSGTLPVNDFDWLIPDDHTSALVISSKTMMGEILPKQYKDKLPGNPQFSQPKRVDDDKQDSAYYITITDGGFDGDSPIEKSWLRPSYSNRIWTGERGNAIIGEKGKRIPPRFPYQNFVIKPHGESLFQGWENKINYSQKCARYIKFNINSTIFEDTALMDLSISGQGSINCQIDGENFCLKSNDFLPNVSYEPTSFWDKFTGGVDTEMKDEFRGELAQQAEAKLKQVFNIELPEISLFSIKHLLFPGMDVMQLKQGYFPGDLIIFGDISPKLTTIQVEPLEAMVALKGNQKFTVVPENKNVNWKLDHNSEAINDPGNIDGKGIYTAPGRIRFGSEVIKVTATDGDGHQASAALTLVPSSVALTPSFAFISEADKKPVSLLAHVLDGKKVTWDVESCTGSQCGSVDQNGLYTPPAGRFNDGFTFTSITSTAEDGSQARTIICLMASMPGHGFYKVEPNLRLNVKAGEEIIFKAQADSYNGDPDTWAIFPPRGKLSEPEFERNDDPETNETIFGHYKVTYTAPTNVTSPELLVVHVWEKNKHNEKNKGKAGYALIEIIPDDK